MNEPTKQPKSTPDLSVLVPTHGRPEALARLVECLGRQTLAPERFELVIVDDGGEPRAEVDPAAWRFRCNVLRQPNAGPAAARNAGLALCRAPLVLILNDDAVPAEDLLECHLAAHRDHGPGFAVLGTFHFTENSRRSPFTRLLDESDLLFGFSRLAHGACLTWQYFWTCNISLSRDAILEVGGFDAENFDWAICEDVELGLRLEKAGHRLVFRMDCRAEHEHVLTPEGYLKRAIQLGKYSTRLSSLHGVAGPAWSLCEEERRNLIANAVTYIEGRRHAAHSFFGLMEDMERTYEGVNIPTELAEDAKVVLQQHAYTYTVAGAFEETTGINALKLMEEGPSPGLTVGIVIVSCNARAHTRRCIETLRAKADSRFPQTLYVVDNGSTDGSAEWLRGPGAGPDLVLIENPFNFGAPRARNQALLVAESHPWICFLDNDVFVTNDWLERALYHGEVDPAVGSVSLCASRASKHQVIPYDGASDQASLDAFADEHFAEAPRNGLDTTLFTSLGVLVRSEVLDRIGGFDEAFSPWGFEDDDLSLRILMAGWRNRVARDTYVHHAAYGSEEKAERHDEWMRSNWETFLAKWSPAACGAALFDYSKVQIPQPKFATETQIRFALPSLDAPIPEWAGCGPERVAAAQVEVGQGEPFMGLDPESGAEASPEPESMHREDPAGEVSAAVAEVLGSRTVVPAGKSATQESTTSDGPVFVVSPSTKTAAELARALGWNSGQEQAMRGLNDYLLAGTSLMSTDGLWIGDPLGEVPNTLDAAPVTEVRAVLQPGIVHAEPRLAATLPAWLDHAPGARVVLVVTDPSALVGELRAAAAQDPGCDGLEIDDGTAVGLWLRTIQRAMELSRERRGESRWLFVLAEDLGEKTVQARIEAFTGCSLRSSATLGSVPRPGAAPLPAVAATYRAACAMARRESVAAQRQPESPDLTVMLDVAGPPSAWGSCVESLERQSLEAGAFEIIASCRDAEALEHLRARESGIALRVLDATGMTLGAARNEAIAEARGAYGLFVDASTRPAMDLLEQHLVALAAAGPDRIIRGPVIPFGEAQGRNLARLLMAFRSPTGIAGEDPAALHEWPKFDSSNLCVSIEAMRSVGLFDGDSNDRAYLDAEIGYRLQAETGARIVIANEACTESLCIAALSEWRDEIRRSQGAGVRVTARHPAALAQRDWRLRLSGNVDSHLDMIRSTFDGRGRAEAFAEQLSSVDVGSLGRAGEEGGEIAEVLCEALAEYLLELDALYRVDGELEAFHDLGVTGFQELLEQGSPRATQAPSPATPVGAQ